MFCSHVNGPRKQFIWHFLLVNSQPANLEDGLCLKKNDLTSLSLEFSQK